ncbi:hypothetical protein QA584_11345 [Anaerocolumna sp. AGMB13025]|uniref:hypothetical protein n=1 Tax=Anaerocolumna sp. AGMB13025 TaxID=3039116 RepID=UPI00241BF9C5|nr:hypothetical protein [Anaerocolumna sp. AGMB13025]WFR59649.1 hypothetical protein QA584_11345 [Anaerocolumna sp. AGMB13025]
MDINQEKKLSKYIGILLGVCMLTAFITILGGYYSANIFIKSSDEYFKDFYNGMTGGIIPLFISGTVYLSKYFFAGVLLIIPIAEAVISFLLLIIALLFQSGLVKKWKIIVSNLSVGIMNIVKVVFIVYLSFLIYLTVNFSFLLIGIYCLQLLISVLPILLSIKYIHIPSYKQYGSKAKANNTKEIGMNEYKN